MPPASAQPNPACPPLPGSVLRGHKGTHCLADCAPLRANHSITVGPAVAATPGRGPCCSRARLRQTAAARAHFFLALFIIVCYLNKCVRLCWGQGGTVASRTWSRGPNDLGVRSPWESALCVKFCYLTGVLGPTRGEGQRSCSCLPGSSWSSAKE